MELSASVWKSMIVCGCLLALTWDKTFPISSATPAPVPARRGAALFSSLGLGVYVFIGVGQLAENGLKF